MKAQIFKEGRDWTAYLTSGARERFPALLYGKGACWRAQSWAEAQGATVIEWHPCPEHERRGEGLCDVCGGRMDPG